MQWFYNLKIGKKLISSFIVVALISAIVGVVGMININKMDELNDTMYQNHTASLPELANIARAYQRVRVDLRNLYIEKDASQRQGVLDNIQSNKALLDQSMKNFEATMNDKLVIEKFEALSSTIEDFYDFTDDVIAAVQANQMDQAYDLIRGSRASQIGTNVQAYTDDLMNRKTELAKQSSDDASKAADKAVTTMAIIVLAAIFVAIFLGVLVSRIISRPVNKMVEATDKLAQGDFSITVEAKTKDEIGQLASYLNRMIEKNNEVLASIATASEQVATGSKQVSDSSLALSQGATEQASSIEELTASLEEISSQTKLNAENANRANHIAETAMSNATLGNNQMQEMLHAMEEINVSSANISKIIKVIDEIAFQTNILALNAAVEAARAGQHGKGFAVVAEEVRNLAARSANAAKETTDMIESSIKKVEGGTKIAKETAEALNNIVTGIQSAATLVNDIAVASNEQATGVEQINLGVMQISQVIQANSAISEESAAASEELSGQAAILKQMVGKFKLKEQAKGYSGLSELNPQVLAMLENMADKKNKGTALAQDDSDGMASGKMEIALSDREFGKY